MVQDLQQKLNELDVHHAALAGEYKPDYPQMARLNAELEDTRSELKQAVTMPEGFILPGATPASGALDLARAITRRAERRCVALERVKGLENQQVRRWLNRLSLLLFVLGRYEEGLAGRVAPPARSAPQH